MKPSSFLTVAVATVLITLCASFSSGKGASRTPANSLSASHQSATAVAPDLLRQGTHYYWYLTGDHYDGFFTIADEISRLETMYGVYVDLSPTGGATLLSKGYILYGTPHMVWASYSCYGHF